MRARLHTDSRAVEAKQAAPLVGLPVEGTMPSLSGATQWLNSSLTPELLRGKVVLEASMPYSTRTGAGSTTAFHARDLHLVLGAAPDGKPSRFRITIDGAPTGQQPRDGH
jgi:hypothetical protein